MQHGDQYPEDDQELALLEQVSLAGLPDDVGDAAHGLVHRQGLGLLVLDPAEDGANGAHHDAEIHQPQAAHASQTIKFDLRQVRNMNIRLAGVSAS